MYSKNYSTYVSVIAVTVAVQTSLADASTVRLEFSGSVTSTSTIGTGTVPDAIDVGDRVRVAVEYDTEEAVLEESPFIGTSYTFPTSQGSTGYEVTIGDSRWHVSKDFRIFPNNFEQGSTDGIYVYYENYSEPTAGGSARQFDGSLGEDELEWSISGPELLRTSGLPSTSDDIQIAPGEIYLTFGEISSSAPVDINKINDPNYIPASWFVHYEIDPNSVQLSNGRNLDPGVLGASVISSFRNYYEGAKNTDRTYLERLDDCAAQGAECDFDAVANDQEFQQNLQNAADATFNAKDLVTRTSITPQNKLELAAEAPTLWGEIEAFFQWVGVLPEDPDRPEIINASVEGEFGEFTVNPTFDFYTLDYSIEFSGTSIFDDLLGEEFLFDYEFGESIFQIGHGTIVSTENLSNGNSLLNFSINQLETNDDLPSPVPLPASAYFLLAAIIGLIGAGRRKPRVTPPGNC